MKLLLVVLLLFVTLTGSAQRYDTVSIFSVPVSLDTVVVKAGFDTKAFIKRIKTDTTFYKTFKTMRLMPWVATSKFVALDKRGREEASLYLVTRQDIRGNCRVTHDSIRRESGHFFRNGKPAYYTAEMFFNLFFAEKPVCNETDIVEGSLVQNGNSRLEKNKYQLKQLMFNPGSRVEGVPFMGDKAAVFNEDELEKYDLRVIADTFNGMPSFKFTVTPKEAYKKDVVYNNMTTWLKRDSYHILGKEYSLSFNTLLYTFDVHMYVTTVEKNGKLVPAHIKYDGRWHIFTKPAERMLVEMDVVYH